MNEKIAKLDRNLKIIAVLVFVIALLLMAFVYHSYRTMEKPWPNMRITFEMYRAQFELLEMIIFQALPLIAGAFVLIGIAIFYYIKKRSEIGDEPGGQNATRK
jgi:uncharacterized membrane protein